MGEKAHYVIPFNILNNDGNLANMIYGYIKVACETYIHLLKKNALFGEIKQGLDVIVSVEKALDIVQYKEMPNRFRSLYLKFLNKVFLSQLKLNSIINLMKNQNGYLKQKTLMKFSKKEMAVVYLNEDLDLNQHNNIGIYRTLCHKVLAFTMENFFAMDDEANISDLSLIYRSLVYVKQGLLYGCLHYIELQVYLKVFIGLLNFRIEVSQQRKEGDFKSDKQGASEMNFGKLIGISNKVIWSKIEIEIFSILECCGYYKDFYFRALLQKYFSRLTFETSFLESKCEDLFNNLDLIHYFRKKDKFITKNIATHITDLLESYLLQYDEDQSKAGAFFKGNNINHPGENLERIGNEDNMEARFFAKENDTVWEMKENKNDFTRTKIPLKGDATTSRFYKTRVNKVKGRNTLSWVEYDKIFLEYNEIQISLKKRLLSQEFSNLLAKNANDYKNLLTKMRRAQLKSINVFLVYVSQRKNMLPMINSLFIKYPSYISYTEINEYNKSYSKVPLILNENHYSKISSQSNLCEMSEKYLVIDQISTINKVNPNTDELLNEEYTVKIPDSLFYYIHKVEGEFKWSLLEHSFDVIKSALTKFEKERFENDKFQTMQSYLRSNKFIHVFKFLETDKFDSKRKEILIQFLQILELYVKDNHFNQKECFPLRDSLLELISKHDFRVASTLIYIMRPVKRLKEIYRIANRTFKAIEAIYLDFSIFTSDLSTKEETYKQLIKVLTGISFTNQINNLQVANYTFELFKKSALFNDLMNLKLTMKFFGEKNNQRNSQIIELIYDLASICKRHKELNSTQISSDLSILDIVKCRDNFSLKFIFLDLHIENYMDRSSSSFSKSLYNDLISKVIKIDLEKYFLLFLNKNDEGAIVKDVNDEGNIQEEKEKIANLKANEKIFGKIMFQRNTIFGKAGQEKPDSDRDQEKIRISLKQEQKKLALKQEMLKYFFHEKFSQVSGLFVVVRDILDWYINWQGSKEVYGKTSSLKNEEGLQSSNKILQDLQGIFNKVINQTDLMFEMTNRLEDGSLSHIQFWLLVCEIEKKFAELLKEPSKTIEDHHSKDDNSIIKNSQSKITNRTFNFGFEGFENSESQLDAISKQLEVFILSKQVSLSYVMSSLLFQSFGDFSQILENFLSLIECQEINSSILKLELTRLHATQCQEQEAFTENKPICIFSFVLVGGLIQKICERSDYKSYSPINYNASSNSSLVQRKRFAEIQSKFEEKYISLGRFKYLLKSIQTVSNINNKSFLALFSNFVAKDSKIISHTKSFEAPNFFLSLNEIALQNLKDESGDGSSLNIPISDEIINTIIKYILNSKSEKLLRLSLRICYQYSKINNAKFVTALFSVFSSDPFIFAKFLKRLNFLFNQTGLNYYDDILNFDRSRRLNCDLMLHKKTIEGNRELLKNILNLIFIAFNEKMTINPKILRIIEKNSSEIEVVIYKNTANILLKIADILCRIPVFQYTKLDKKIVMRLFMILEISLKNSKWNISLLWRSFNNYTAQLANICNQNFSIIKNNYFYCVYIGLLVKMINLFSISIKESHKKSNTSITIRDYDCFIILCENIYKNIIKSKQKLFIRDRICSLGKKSKKLLNTKCSFTNCLESFVPLAEYSLYETAFKSYLTYKEILGDSCEKERDNFWNIQNSPTTSAQKSDSSFDYFKKSEVQLEICLKNVVFEYSFQKQLICFHFDHSLMKKFLTKLSKTHAHDDYRIIFDEIPYYFEEMILNEKFKSKFLMQFAAHHSNWLSAIIYTLTLLINAILLIFVKIEDPSDSQMIIMNRTFVFSVFEVANNSNAVIIPYLIVGMAIVLLVFYDLSSKIAVSWYKSGIFIHEFASDYDFKYNNKNLQMLYNNGLGKLSLKIQNKLEGAIKRFRSKHPILQKVMSVLSLKNVYAIFFMVLIIMSILFPFLWSFVLLDIFRINSSLRSFTKSFKFNLLNILKIFWICVIIVFIYATIIFTFFNSIPISTDTVSPTTYFVDLSACLYQTFMNALIRQKGIGDFFGDVEITDLQFWRRFFLDITFFFVIIVVVLNALYATVIETYFNFSRKQKNKHKSLERICYICLRNQHELKLIDEDFTEHIEGKHNAKNYFYLFVNLYLRKSSSSNYVGRVLSKMVSEKDFSFIPIKQKPKHS